MIMIVTSNETNVVRDENIVANLTVHHDRTVFADVDVAANPKPVKTLDPRPWPDVNVCPQAHVSSNSHKAECRSDHTSDEIEGSRSDARHARQSYTSWTVSDSGHHSHDVLDVDAEQPHRDRRNCFAQSG